MTRCFWRELVDVFAVRAQLDLRWHIGQQDTTILLVEIEKTLSSKRPEKQSAGLGQV